MVELFPQNERGLSLDVFLRQEELNKKEMITLSIHGYSGRPVPVRYSIEPPEQIAESVQRVLNCVRTKSGEPIREVFFHNAESSPLPDKIYTPVRDYLIKAQTKYKSRHPITLITFGQDRIPVVGGR